MELIVALTVLAILLASGRAWFEAAARLRAGESLLPVEPHRPAPWGLVDVALMILLLFGLSQGAGAVLRTTHDIKPGVRWEELPLDTLAAFIFASSAATLLAFVLSVCLVRLRTSASWRDLGFDRRRILSDVWLGAVAFVMLAPPVYAMQFVLVQLFEFIYEQPLIDLLKDRPDPRVIGLAFFSAVIAAPLVEEYQFRVLFQGWLEKADKFRGGIFRLLLSSETETVASGDQRPPFWPILASALFFAFAHLPQGLAPIPPLFVLGLGLGYLYQRTHRILPCIVLHLLLNGFSLAILLLEVFFGDSPTRAS